MKKSNLKNRQSKNHAKQFQRATGLVEVVVVIGILAVTMVSVIGVTIKSMRQVKRDEIEDKASGFQIRSLELAKSPATLVFPSTLLPGDVKSFYIKTNAGTQTGIEFILSNTSTNLSTTNCTSSSEYSVKITGAEPGELYCNQIIVEVKSENNKNFYIVKSVMVYKSLDKFLKKELITYRRD